MVKLGRNSWLRQGRRTPTSLDTAGILGIGFRVLKVL